jgi:flagellar biosynthesis GTPase FlhF
LDEFEDFPINGKAIPKSLVSSPKSSMDSKAHEDSAAEARFGDAIVNSFSAAKIRCPPLNLKLKNSFDGLEVEENTQPVPPQVSIATMASPTPRQTSGKKLSNKQKQKIKVKERKQARKESRKQTAEDQTAEQKASEQQAAAQRAGDKENAHEPAADVLILGKNSKEELVFLTFWTKMFCEDLEKTKELIYGFYEARGLENTLEFLNATFRGRYQTDDWRSAALAEVSAEVNGMAEKVSAAVVA